MTKRIQFSNNWVTKLIVLIEEIQIFQRETGNNSEKVNSWITDTRHTPIIKIPLSRELEIMLSSLLDELVLELSKTDKLSFLTVRALINDLLVSVLINESDESIETKARKEIAKINIRYSGSPKLFQVYVPVEGITSIETKISFGKLNLINLKPLEISQLKNKEDASFILSDLKEGVYANLSVCAYESSAALSIGIKEVRYFLNVINYLINSILKRNYLLYLPGELNFVTRQSFAFISDSGESSYFSYKSIANSRISNEELINLSTNFTESMAKFDLENVQKPNEELIEYAIFRSMNWAGKALMETAQEKYVDALLSFIISLEILLLPVEGSELTYRFCQRGAFIVSTGKDNLESEVLKSKIELTSLYKFRSGIVHYGDTIVTDPILTMAESYSRRVINYFLTNENIKSLKTTGELENYFFSKIFLFN